MSNLLSQASLVMIPSGYKEDVVYSAVPTNGNGDLSFTRASNGTRVNSAGLVEVVPWNLVEQSESIGTSPWSTVSGGTASAPVITANDTTAPNGTMTADKVVFDTGAGTSGTDRSTIYQDILNQPIGIYTASIYAKVASGTAKIIMRSAGGGQYTTLNLTTEWQRFEVAETNVVFGAINLEIGLRRGLANEPLTSPVTCYLWGAQLNIGSTAKPYFPTTDRLNVPRLTYQNGGGGCPSLLLEKQSTNLFTYSEDLSNGWTTNNTTITTNTTTSPDGTQNADKMADSINTASAFYIYQSPATTSTQYTSSGYFKKGEYNFVTLHAFGLNGAVFNLNTGVLVSQSGGTGTITDVGNGWYRCTFTFTAGGSAVFFSQSPAGNISYTGTIGSGIYAWGAQVEASSYPTSYIPTTSSSATRVADACSKTGISSLIGQSEGTVFLNYTLLNNSTDDITIGITGNNGKIIWFRKNGIQFYGNGTTLLFDASSTGTMGVTYKMAFVYGQSDFRLYINGTFISSATSGTFTGTFDDFTFFPVGGAPYTNANKINEMVFFPTKLTNAELASITTI